MHRPATFSYLGQNGSNLFPNEFQEGLAFRGKGLYNNGYIRAEANQDEVRFDLNITNITLDANFNFN